MKYALVIYNYKSGQIKPIVGYSMSGIVNVNNENKLQSIDNFTRYFATYNDLLVFLRQNKLIKSSDLQSETEVIAIAKHTSSGFEVSSYNLIFEDYEDFNDKTEMIEYYQEKISNPHFLKAFLNAFRDLEKITYFFEIKELKNTDIDIEKDISKKRFLIKNFIEKFIIKKSGNEVSYSAKRRLTVFARNYDKTHPIFKDNLDDSYEIKEIKAQIAHCHIMLSNPNIGYDECVAQTTKLAELESELKNIRKQERLVRGNKDETTGY